MSSPWLHGHASLGALSILGKAMGAGMADHLKQVGIAVPAELTGPANPPSAEQAFAFLRGIAAQIFPLLAAPKAQNS